MKKIDFSKIYIRVNLVTLIRIYRKLRKFFKRRRKGNVLVDKEGGTDAESTITTADVREE